MFYQVRLGKLLQMPWWQCYILRAIDWFDDHIRRNKTNTALDEWLATVWLRYVLRASHD